ncbi:MAG: tRNA (uridine(34)/cytosine(34)/5-carboxymethylaminomethyluridine(34)-2'-O)-methyltransferase TrmL [Defluviitaleaceae bacterium]|nr:tRNA (uridine(34)/cytosine(34)/5-carboxymethylaminomethyluridine(34)-2'-O)-methyltransferase TrmL [Defluviitaleaceae bacterium]
MNIVLHEPEIPQNTGNIGRTCVAADAKLHLIKPLAFDTSEKAVRRSGLDYWHLLDVSYYDNFEDFLLKNNNPQVFMVETKGIKCYTNVSYSKDSYIMFGKETRGIPDEILNKYAENCIRIPMIPNNRSLNLSNSVAIVLYEALRQNGFIGLK